MALVGAGTYTQGSDTEFDNKVLYDMLTQVSSIIYPKKEFAAVRAPDTTTVRSPDVGGTPSVSTPRAPVSSTGSRTAGAAGSTAGSRAGGAESTTNADGTPAPTSAGAVKQEIELDTSRSPEGVTPSKDHTAEGETKQKTDAENQKNEWLSKVGGLGGLALIGLTLALATKIATDSIMDYKACVDSKITITKVSPSPRGPDWLPDWEWLQNLLPIAKTVDVKYSVDNDYVPLADSDSWDISGTEVIDGKEIAIEKVLEGKVVRVKCGKDDCSDVNSTLQGSADANCDYADRLNKAVEDTASDIGSVMNKFLKTAGSIFMSFLPIIIVVGVVFLFIMFFK